MLILYKFWNVQFSWYQKITPTTPRVIISTTFMIIFIENMQKLRVSNAATCKNMRFELQLKRSKRSFITHITYLNSQLLLLYIVQSYFGHYGNMWSGCSITFAPYIHFQLKLKCIASVTHRRHDTSTLCWCWQQEHTVLRACQTYDRVVAPWLQLKADAHGRLHGYQTHDTECSTTRLIYPRNKDIYF